MSRNEPHVALSTALARLGMSRDERANARANGQRGRLVRPRALLLLWLIVLGFVLTSVLPLVPLVWLGSDAADAVRRATTLERELAQGPAALLSPSALSEVQTQVAALQTDLAALNGVGSVLVAPIAVVSGQARTYRLLLRMGADLASVAADAVYIAHTVLTPLEGSALATPVGTPGVTQSDLVRAQVRLADAQARLRAAIADSAQLDAHELPAQLRPGTHLGTLLTQLPQALSALDQVQAVLAAAPRLLGIGQPAYYLVLAMDQTELRPAGGLMGNYGILTLVNGQQSRQRPLALEDTYVLDHAYYDNPALNSDPHPVDTPACVSSGPQPPAIYWWWPIRDFSCQYGWGLRDSGLSPDFPTNARMAMSIAEQANVLPKGATFQGVVAFTPQLIAQVLAVTGPITLPQYRATVTAANLETQIHQNQLLGTTPAGQDRKAFTHDLSIALIQRLRSLHGGALKAVLAMMATGLADKTIEVYLAAPSAETLLQQRGLSASIGPGTQDGFYVVDTNDGANKANQYVTEQQTDVVTILPDGSALHVLQIAVTYNKTGPVYQGTTGFEDYSDVQRTYLPGDATMLGYAGFDPAIFTPAGCTHGGYASPISACSAAHAITAPSTVSDTPGHAMVQGPILVPCGTEGRLIYYNSVQDYTACDTHPTPHTRDIYITWYTPHAVALTASGHGTYTELVQKQPGSNDSLTVYVAALAASGAAEQAQQVAIELTNPVLNAAERAAIFASVVSSARRIYAAPLARDTTINVRF